MSTATAMATAMATAAAATAATVVLLEMLGSEELR
jgi:hypothetical protein